MVYKQKAEGRMKAVVTDAFIFEAVDLDVEGVPSHRFFTKNAAWDTGAEITILSPRVVETLGLKSVGKSSVMGIGGDEEVDVFCIHVGLPNGYLYEDLIVYCSEIDDYDILIGMDLISQSDFFLTNIKGDNIFAFQYPATGKIE